MGNLAQLAAEGGGGGGGREEGYGSDGERPQKKRGERAAGVLVNLSLSSLSLIWGVKRLDLFRRFRAWVGVDRHFV